MCKANTYSSLDCKISLLMTETNHLERLDVCTLVNQDIFFSSNHTLSAKKHCCARFKTVCQQRLSVPIIHIFRIKGDQMQVKELMKEIISRATNEGSRAGPKKAFKHL